MVAVFWVSRIFMMVKYCDVFRRWEFVYFHTDEMALFMSKIGVRAAEQDYTPNQSVIFSAYSWRKSKTRLNGSKKAKHLLSACKLEV